MVVGLGQQQGGRSGRGDMPPPQRGWCGGPAGLAVAAAECTDRYEQPATSGVGDPMHACPNHCGDYLQLAAAMAPACPTSFSS